MRLKKLSILSGAQSANFCSMIQVINESSFIEELISLMQENKKPNRQTK